jgi:hypothetical protein
MRLVLANPAGLWALAAIPLVLLIHFLQEQSRRVRSSTLFLLDRVKPESVGGARLDRLRNSVPLWLQLLAVAIIAWLLAEPRWIRQDSRQTVVVVLDSSVSMSAFKKETRAMLEEKLRRWAAAAARTDWYLLESGPRKPRLYAGTELRDLLQAFESWEPAQGTHAPDAALFAARNLVRGNAGLVILVTDRKTDVPADVALLSAGAPLENVGIAGGEARIADGGGMIWRALVKNYGREKQEREWWFEEEGRARKAEGASDKRRLVIEPGQTITLEGGLPPGIERATLVLSSDRFAWDDRLPLQKPKPRIVRVALRLPGMSGDLLKRIFAALDGVELGSLTPDLVVDELGNAIETDAVQLGGSTGENGVLDPAWVAAEDHRLTRDLAWSGLLSGRPLELTLGEGDVPLLWKGSRALALLRPGATAEGKQIQRLILNWDLAQSNAARVPALPVMLQRFVEMVRERKEEPWAGNFEAGEQIEITNHKSKAATKDQLVASKVELRSGSGTTGFDGRAPERPGFFEVIEGGNIFLSGAAHFADTREADFREAETFDSAEERRVETVLRQSEADPWTPLWVLLLAGCFLGAWASRRGRVSASRRPVPPYSRKAGVA